MEEQVLKVIEYLAPTEESDETIYKFLSGAEEWNPAILISIIRKLLLRRPDACSTIRIDQP
jgi:hypothetical protein